MPGMHSRGCRRVCPHTIRSCWQLGAQEALERPHPMIARTLVCALVDRATGICAVSLDMQGSLSLSQGSSSGAGQASAVSVPRPVSLSTTAQPAEHLNSAFDFAAAF